MDKNNIIKDLKDFLDNKSKFTQKNEVVYLLVQIRKILDLDRSNQYKTLRFYCNWVLHTKLDKPATTKLMANIFNESIDLNTTEHQNARNIKAVGEEFFILKTFKTELADFLNKNKLAKSSFDDRLLLEIIKDCPIELIPNKIQKIEVNKKNNFEYHYKFNIIGKKDKPKVKLKYKRNNQCGVQTKFA